MNSINERKIELLKKGYKKGTNKNGSPANLLFTSVFEYAQCPSPVSRVGPYGVQLGDIKSCHKL